MMIELPIDIKEQFFKVTDESLGILEFERWLYENQQLEDIYSESDYFELIAFNYKSKESLYELKKLLFKTYISFGEFEKWRLIKRLNEVLEYNYNMPDILVEIYELYCCGYDFLRDLGLKYGLAMECDYYSNFERKKWEEFSIEQRKEYRIKLYPELECKVKQVLSWLENDIIVLQNSKYEYIDNREQSKQQPTKIVSQNNNLEPQIVSKETNIEYSEVSHAKSKVKMNMNLWKRISNYWFNSYQ